MPIACQCRQQEIKEKEEREAIKAKVKRLEQLRKYSMMNEKFYSCTFENWDWNLAGSKEDRKMYNFGKRYIEKWSELKAKHIGLMLLGEKGVGKTRLSFCIANALLNQFVPVIAISSGALLERIDKARKSYGEEGQYEVLNALRNADLIVLDDLGAEYSSAWGQSIMYTIIDNLVSLQKNIIITSNKNREDLASHLTGTDGVGRAYDRLLELCTMVEYKGSSKRPDIQDKRGTELWEIIGK